MMRISTEDTASLQDHNHDEEQQRYGVGWASKTFCNIKRGTILLCTFSFLFGIIVLGTSVFILSTDLPAFHELFVIDDLKLHLEAFQEIANNNFGSRSVTKGYNDSVQHIVETLSTFPSYFKVTIQEFPIKIFNETSSPQLSYIEEGTVIYFELSSFQTLKYSASGSVSGVLSHVGAGCSLSDFPVANNQSIALVKRGGCKLQDKVQYAQEAGYIAILIYNDNTGSFYGTLGAETYITIPALAVSDEVGEILKQFPADIIVNVVVNSFSYQTTTSNLIAESIDGNDNNRIVVGAHLDSVDGSPGINDNGSGSAALIAIAYKFAKKKISIKNKLVFAWWGAEEEGLIGSSHYLTYLEEQGEISKIVANINVDIIGSPNYQRAVYNATGTDDSIKATSLVIQELFEYFFTFHEISYELTPFSGRSDYESFTSRPNPIPSGGLFTGSEFIKTDQQRTLFGGITSAPFDPCYHKACDNIDNVNFDVLLNMTKALSHVTYDMATNSNLRADLLAN